jgi:hypothetical protein
MIAPQRPQPRQNAIFIRTGEPAVTDYIRRQYRRKLPGLRHGASQAIEASTKTRQNLPVEKANLDRPLWVGSCRSVTTAAG